MKPTYEELKKIHDEQERERERFALAEKLDICPECGAKLIRKTKTFSNGWWIFKSENYITVKICDTDETHYKKVIDDSSWYSERDFY